MTCKITALKAATVFAALSKKASATKAVMKVDNSMSVPAFKWCSDKEALSELALKLKYRISSTSTHTFAANLDRPHSQLHYCSRRRCAIKRNAYFSCSPDSPLYHFLHSAPDR